MKGEYTQYFDQETQDLKWCDTRNEMETNVQSDCKGSNDELSTSANNMEKKTSTTFTSNILKENTDLNKKNWGPHLGNFLIAHLKSSKSSVIDRKGHEYTVSGSFTEESENAETNVSPMLGSGYNKKASNKTWNSDIWCEKASINFFDWGQNFKPDLSMDCEIDNPYSDGAQYSDIKPAVISQEKLDSKENMRRHVINAYTTNKNLHECCRICGHRATNKIQVLPPEELTFCERMGLTRKDVHQNMIICLQCLVKWQGRCQLPGCPNTSGRTPPTILTSTDLADKGINRNSLICTPCCKRLYGEIYSRQKGGSHLNRMNVSLKTSCDVCSQSLKSAGEQIIIHGFQVHKFANKLGIAHDKVHSKMLLCQKCCENWNKLKYTTFKNDCTAEKSGLINLINGYHLKSFCQICGDCGDNEIKISPMYKHYFCRVMEIRPEHFRLDMVLCNQCLTKWKTPRKCEVPGCSSISNVRVPKITTAKVLATNDISDNSRVCWGCNARLIKESKEGSRRDIQLKNQRHRKTGRMKKCRICHSITKEFTMLNIPPWQKATFAFALNMNKTEVHTGMTICDGCFENKWTGLEIPLQSANF